MKYALEGYKDRKGEFRWRLLASNGKIVADSAESYKTKYNLSRAMARFVKGISMYPSVIEIRLM
jgi:uncharacterized protein